MRALVTLFSTIASLGLSACNWMSADYWALVKRGHSLAPNCMWSRGEPIHCLEVYEDTLERLGGTKTAAFHQYATDLLKERALCPKGWKRPELPTGYGTK